MNINTPPLRDRKEDIPLLVKNFIRKYGVEYNRRNLSISEKALQLLHRHSWPGNIRELENVVQRAIIMSERSIEIEHFPDYLKYPTPTPNGDDLLKPLKEIEKEHILKVLASVDNNKTRAAEILQIDRKTLRQKLQ